MLIDYNATAGSSIRNTPNGLILLTNLTVKGWLAHERPMELRKCEHVVLDVLRG